MRTSSNIDLDAQLFVEGRKAAAVAYKRAIKGVRKAHWLIRDSRGQVLYTSNV